jgi:hypothetical protein
MELNPSLEAASCAATQELARNLWDPKVHYRVHKSPLLVPILSQINRVHTISSYSSIHHFNIIHPPSFCSSWRSFSSLLSSSNIISISSSSRSNMSWDSSVDIVTLQAGRPRNRCLSPGRVKDFLNSSVSRPSLGSTKPATQSEPGVKRRSVKLSTHLEIVPRQENVELYIHSFIRLHGVVLN